MRRILLFLIFLFLLTQPIFLYGQAEILETKIEDGITVSHIIGKWDGSI